MTDTTAPASDAPGAPSEVHGCPVSYSCGQTVVHTTPGAYAQLVRALLDDGYTMAVDITATDYLTHPGRTVPDGVVAERFEVVVNMVDMNARRRIRVRAQVPEADPHIPSLFEWFPGAEALEREVFDMFGIVFDDHPDLTRILMPEDWEGHPLRKDYAVGSIPVQFSSDLMAGSASASLSPRAAVRLVAGASLGAAPDSPLSDAEPAGDGDG